MNWNEPEQSFCKFSSHVLVYKYYNDKLINKQLIWCEPFVHGHF